MTPPKAGCVDKATGAWAFGRWIETAGDRSAMDVAALADAVIAGDRRALARAVTIIESSRHDHRAIALELGAAMRATGRRALRVGLTGTPGVGKSTFTEALGLHIAGKGLRTRLALTRSRERRTTQVCCVARLVVLQR